MAAKEITLGVSGGSKTVNYEISCTTAVSFAKGNTADTWYTLDNNQATKKLTISASTNSTTSGRSATIIPSVDGTECPTKDIKITQDFYVPWLSFKAIDDCEFVFESENHSLIEYSYDPYNGDSWTGSVDTNTGVTQVVNVPAGQRIYWRCVGPKDHTPGDEMNFGNFSESKGRFEVDGNIMTLLINRYYEGNAHDLTDFPYIFQNLFYDCSGVTTAENLSLPATTLSKACYESMFAYCSNLTTAPILPAPTLVEACYDNLFLDCKKLNYIKCLATDFGEENCTYSWVDNVAESGTFVKAETADWSWEDCGSYSVIPCNWAVQDE